MATKEEILGTFVGESGPMNRMVMAKKLGIPLASFASQLERLVKQELVGKNEQQEYSLTEVGQQYLQTPPAQHKTTSEEPTAEAPTSEAPTPTPTTEFDHFVKFGLQTGVVPKALIEQTANHISSGGGFQNLTWVWQGLCEMGIRPDLARRWFHSWRSYLHQSIPERVATEVRTTPPVGEEEEAKSVTGKRAYIIGPNDMPLFVGEGVGDLDYDDAVKLSAIRVAGLARGGGQTAPPGQHVGTQADEMVKVFNAVKEFLGPQSKGKSYVVKPGEKGYAVEEIEEGKPTILSPPGGGGGPPSPSFLVDSEGNVTEVPPGRPVVLKQAAPPPAPQSPQKTFIVRQTAEGIVAEEHEVGKPIIINANPPSASAPPMMPFPVFDANGQPVLDTEGKPVYANLEPTLKWLGFQSEQRRADERHSALMGLAQVVKENIGDGVAAIKVAAEEARHSPKPGKEGQAFECSQCHAQFSVPPGQWNSVKCPSCQREYTREEVFGA